jgi:dephospho-CoA kinase
VTLQLFGLTGGIGSGKSTVARRFRARGLPVLDADVLAREVVAKGNPALSEIVARFGGEMLDADGNLDRKKLAAHVFQDDEARHALNNITHPRVGSLLTERAGALARRGEPLACYEVPLLFEAGLDTVLRPIVVVNAPIELRVERTVLRDAGTAEEVLARIRAQMPLDEKARRADYVIDNAASPEELVARADEVFDAVCGRQGVRASLYPRP